MKNKYIPLPQRLESLEAKLEELIKLLAPSIDISMQERLDIANAEIELLKGELKDKVVDSVSKNY